MIKFGFYLCFLLVSTTINAQQSDPTTDPVTVPKSSVAGSSIEPSTSAQSSSVPPTQTTVAQTTTTPSSLLPCEDTRDCSLFKAQCGNINYLSLMYTNCRKTCNFCALCIDANEGCKVWVPNGFCTNPFYASARANCAKSCKLCSV